MFNLFKPKQVELPNNPPHNAGKLFLQVVFNDGSVIESSIIGNYYSTALDKLSDAIHGPSMFLRLTDTSNNLITYYNKSTIKKIIVLRTESYIVEFSR